MDVSWRFDIITNNKIRLYTLMYQSTFKTRMTQLGDPLRYYNTDALPNCQMQGSCRGMSADDGRLGDGGGFKNPDGFT